jgi:tetratricopeptide (TPR) repeat protein
MNYFSMSISANFRQKSISLLFATLLLTVFCIGVFAQTEDDEQDPVIIFNLGQEAHEKGDFSAAVKFYDEALKIAPEFPEAQYQKGNALLSLNKFNEAENSFRKAVELREDWTLAMAALGSLLVRNNEFAEAETVLNKAVELDPLNFPAITALTDLHLKTKASSKVLQELYGKVKNLTEKAKPTSSIWASRAALENALGDKTSAKNSLTRAIEIDPKNQFALMERANIALAEGDTTQAQEIFKTLSTLSPGSQNVKLLSAGINLAEGKADEALKIIDSIANPNEEVLTMRARIIQNSSGNIADLEKQLVNDAKNATILARLCSLQRVSNPAKALSYCQRASEAEPSNVNHAIGFGAALVQAQKYSEAIGLFIKLKNFAPDNSTVHANLATALFQSKRYAEAKTEFQWLTDKQPDLAIAYYYLGIIHDRLAEYLDAMANYQQFLRVADAEKAKLEIEKTNLRLPALQKLIKDKKSKK